MSTHSISINVKTWNDLSPDDLHGPSVEEMYACLSLRGATWGVDTSGGDVCANKKASTKEGVMIFVWSTGVVDKWANVEKALFFWDGMCQI